jgi:hypothetical protein
MSLLVAAFALSLLTPAAPRANGPTFIILDGADGGSVTGPLLGNQFGMGTLSGDMNVRISDGFMPLDPGVTVDVRHNVLTPVLGFGSCFVHPGNFSALETVFAADGLDLVGSENLLAFTVAMQIPGAGLEAAGQEVACLLLFNETTNGQAFPVTDPLNANGFILRGFGGDPMGGRRLINMIGNVSFN